MKTYWADYTEGVFLENDPKRPAKFGRVRLVNPPRLPTATGRLSRGIKARTLITGFCGTDWELLRMGARGELDEKFPPGTKRLITGHEGVVYVPSQKRYAIVLIRGSTGYDPTRYEPGEFMFEYGCHKADGLMAVENYYHGDMLLKIPSKVLRPGAKMPLSLAKKLVYCDPYACALFTVERTMDVAEGHNFRLFRAAGKSAAVSRRMAREHILDRVVIFGLGTVGVLLTLVLKDLVDPEKQKVVAVARSDQSSPKVKFIRKYSPAKYVRAGKTAAETSAKILKALGGPATAFIATSGNPIESEIAFDGEVLGHNAVFNSFSLGPTVRFDSMPFGFKNQLVFGAINFRREHMERAIRELPFTPVDELVKMYEFEDVRRNPGALIERVFTRDKGVIKGAVIWDGSMLDLDG